MDVADLKTVRSKSELYFITTVPLFEPEIGRMLDLPVRVHDTPQSRIT